MKITGFNSNNQRNAGHYQFQTDFNSMIVKYTPKVLDIVDAYAFYNPLYLNEGEAFVAITKSAVSEPIRDADHDRDVTFRGFVDEVRSKQNHFSAEVGEAAKRVLVILDGYGNLAPKPDDEESGSVSSLIADLRTKVPTDLVLLTVLDWVAELERRNNIFIKLQADRNSEEANRTELRMKEVRLEVDAAYRTIVARINALIIVNGDAPYVEFVKELNARIGRAQDAASRKGGSDKDPDSDTPKA